ncbi:major Facilitator Superfamily (MFS) [Thraustotheca clavata]|uniref:Major Facilitator Superfamily (MFS) n=1 Tax=Thraustotheca clavata TaxID=74557 RepID=A0A1W0A8L8_9STRA|nr:major Facilitator Superfamily (MFS) [Thraustotheca clavata]
MTDFALVEWLLYVIQFTSNGGAALIVCFLADMYGVYHVGTMFGMISTSWTVDQALLTLTDFNSTDDFSDQVALFWYISIGGLLLMWFVRTNTFDRFYRGYQLTVCSKVLIRRPNKGSIENTKVDCDLLRGEEGEPSTFFLWTSNTYENISFLVKNKIILHSLSLVKMSRAIRKYWTIALAPKSPYTNEAERYLFYWPHHSVYEFTPRWRCIKFRRFYIFLAVFSVQFCAGSLYAFITLASPINAYFKLDDSNRQADLLFFIAGVLGILSQALLGPLLERSGPQKSMIRGTVGLTLGLALAQIAMTTSSWILLHIGIDIAGIAFGSIVITSISTAQKWCPDLRGTIAGVCLFGYGLGTGLWSSIFHAMLDDSHEALQRVFGLLMIVLVPVLTISGLVLRTPPNNFSVHGYDMHCIPSERAPNVEMVQDEYLKIGQTLVNYKAIMSIHSDSMNEGTDREYHEQVKSLTLTDCILSIDFLCLFIAFAANGLVGLVYTELTAVKVSKDFLIDWFHITSYQASRVRLHGTIADLAGRLVIPVFSDVCIRVFYGNPAVVRKVCFIVLLLIQSIILPIIYFDSDNLSNFTYIQWLLYVVQFCSNGGATLIVCFLTDMYGVYHVGTMYGLLSTSWGIDQVIVSFTDNNSKTGFSSQVALFWYISMAGLLLMFFVRTNSFDRFYRGYQLTLCGRVLIQRPGCGRSHANPKQALIEELALEENPGSFFLWDSDKSSNIKNMRNCTSLATLQMSSRWKTYWTINLSSKAPYLVNAEQWVFFWPFASDTLEVPQRCYLKFNRKYLILATFLVQFCSGSLYAVVALTNPINVYFGYSADSSATTNLVIICCVLSILAQMLLGPIIEKMSQENIAVCIRSWILFHIGVDCCAISYAGMMIISISTATKWSPDLRGTVAGICILGFGLGKELFGELFHQLIPNSDIALKYIIGLMVILLIPFTWIATIIIRTPPTDFSVHGLDMHCIPSQRAPDVDLVQDEYLKIGMTLVNYAVIMENNIYVIDGTDRQYYEQVKALTLTQCILSTDYLCLCLALCANCVVGLFYNHLTALTVSGTILSQVYPLSNEEMDSVRFYGLLWDLGGRLIPAMFSDACIRLLYANPAVARKGFFMSLLLIQSICLSFTYFGSDNLTHFMYVKWMLFVLQFASNGGSSLLVCFLADMYGVYHIGTMYGLSSLTWIVAEGLLMFFPIHSTTDIVNVVEFFMIFSFAALLLLVFVRTNSIDRFFDGYQYSICGKIVIQRSTRMWSPELRHRTWDVYSAIAEMHYGRHHTNTNQCHSDSLQDIYSVVDMLMRLNKNLNYQVMLGCKKYWTIELDAKPLYLVNAERWVFFWPLSSKVLSAPQYNFLHFHRGYLFILMVLMQFSAGTLYAYLNLADAINVHFNRPPGSSETTILAIVGGFTSILSEAFIGPLLERKGPQKSMASGSCILIIGFVFFQVALLSKCWIVFLIGAAICGFGFGIVLILSVAVALKWSPDLRGTITGCCLVGFGIGKEICRLYFNNVVNGSDSQLNQVFWILFLIHLPIAFFAIVVARTPPNDFHVNGQNMHCIPVNKAPSFNLVHDEYLHIGMTLVNYKAIQRRSDSLIEDTDCHYYEQVKALTLPQCIISTDFLCLFLALFGNGLVGLYFEHITAAKCPKSPLEEIYGLNKQQIDDVRYHGIASDLIGRLFMPALSDFMIRLLYANPAVVRKGCYTFVLLLQFITLTVAHFGSEKLTNFTSVEWVLSLLQFSSNSGAALVVCLLTDMFGVYHIATMNGLSAITWVLDEIFLVLLPMTSISDVSSQIGLFWYISLFGLLMIFFVRTNSTDRFYCGYQFTLCGKIIIQRPRSRSYVTRTMDIYEDGPSTRNLMIGCKTYWTIELDPKPLYEVNSESFVFFWPLQSNELIAPKWKFLPFHRIYLIIAMVLVQFCAGSLYAYLNLADAINIYFKRPPGSSETTVLAIESGLASIIAQVFMGPVLERKGPRKSMAASTVVLVAGFAVVQTALYTLCWPLFLVGAAICGMGFGGIIILSVTIALKWSPDLRGTVTGCCLLGFGIGKELSLQYFDRVVDDDDAELPKVFLVLLVVSASILAFATFVIRTPPNDFQISGHNMHCIPANKAPNVEFVQDEYLQIGMTLVNYKVINRQSDSFIEDTDCHYYEQVKALSLPQCILSTDFLCLFIALFTNCLVGLFYNEITATKYPKDPLEDIYSLDESVVDNLRLNGIIVDLTGRLLMPIISDLIIRLLYANPAVVRKLCFTFILLLQCVTLLVVHFGSKNLTNFSYVEWLLYLLQFASNSGASLIVCLLADMFGVYHIGTMYGLTSITWVLGEVLLVLLPMKSISDVAHLVELFWFISLGGLLVMFFVRTNSMDRFYSGYQFTLCGKVIIQRPWQRDYVTRTMDIYADGHAEYSIFNRGSIPYLCASDSLGSLEDTTS